MAQNSSQIRKIERSEINLDKVYTNKYDAANHTNSKVAIKNLWDGNLEIKMTDDPNVGIVYRDGQGLGFINLKDADSIKNVTTTSNNRDVTFDSDEFLKKQSGGNSKLIKPGMMSEEYEIPKKENEFKGKHSGAHNTKLIKPGMMSEEYEIPKKDSGYSRSHSQVNIKSSAGTVSYSGNLHSKKRASDSAKSTNGRLTTDNTKYVILPDAVYAGAPGTISESDYNLLVAQVAGEGAMDVDDMLGVTTTVLNRLEAGDMGDTVRGVLEEGYFPWGRTYKKYIPGGSEYNKESGQIKLANAKAVVDDALNGYRNAKKDVYYYGGDGTHNYFSDKL